MAPKRPQTVHKATPGVAQTRQKTKQVVSTSALFAQIPRLKAAPASKHVTAPKQPQTRRKVAVVISKKRRNHPLLDDFNDITSSYTTDLLSSASSKLVSTRDALTKRLEAATLESLLDPLTKTLRSQISKPLVPTSAISSLNTVAEKEQQHLFELQKDYASVNSSIKDIVHEMSQQLTSHNNGKGKESVVGKTILQQALKAEIAKLQQEINVLGDEEIKGMEREKKVEAHKRAKITTFFMALDEDED